MNVFICWSGEKSKQIAFALRTWLPCVIQGIRPWMSEEDINKGAKWATELGEQLEATSFGVVCLTPDNLANGWLLYETGALSKKLKESFVVPYLFNITPSQVTGPFALFQMAETKQADTYRLIASINDAIGEDRLTNDQLNSSFEKWWPDLNRTLQEVDKTRQVSGIAEVKRTDRDLLEEILTRIREIPREISALQPAPPPYRTSTPDFTRIENSPIPFDSLAKKRGIDNIYDFYRYMARDSENFPLVKEERFSYVFNRFSRAQLDTIITLLLLLDKDIRPKSLEIFTRLLFMNTVTRDDLDSFLSDLQNIHGMNSEN